MLLGWFSDIFLNFQEQSKTSGLKQATVMSSEKNRVKVVSLPEPLPPWVKPFLDRYRAENEANWQQTR